ncbi:MAG: diguanylate cyclase [Anaerolineales bacterium]|nr:diguanylate cyclase [Anaerolineales bacterium]
MVVAPTSLLALALQFTGRGHWLTRARVLALLVEPSLTLALMWTDNWHHLFFAGPPPVGSYFTGGPVFWANVAYSYGLVMIALGLLVQALFNTARSYRQQAGRLLWGTSAPVFSNLLGLFGLNPWPSLDLTPFAFLISGLIFGLALFRQRLLNLVPIARDIVVERLRDGVVVLDDHERVVDFNHSAQTLLGLTNEHLGQPAAASLAAWPGLVAALRATPGRLELNLAGPSRYLDASLTPLPDRLGRPAGAVLVLRDITERREANLRLQQQLAEIQALQEQLREQAIRDSLTGLFNRRYFEETLPRELAEAARDGRPLSLIALDLDNLKQLNDTFGHAAGDRMLAALGHLLLTHTRAGDIACRLGGDEFLILLPGALPASAAARAEQWRTELEGLRPALDGQSLRSTLSAGVAGYPEHALTPAVLRHAADQALYRSKAGGRNRVSVSEPPA